MSQRIMNRAVLALLGWLLVCVAGCASTVCSQSPNPENTDKSAPRVDRQVRIAGIVLKWVRAEKQVNYDRVEPLIRQAAAEGAEIVVTTECFLDGYAIRDKNIPIEQWRAMGEVIPGGCYLKQLQALADELDIYLVAGMLEADGGQTYNAAVLIDADGKLIGHYRKQHMGHELVRNIPGDASPVFETPFGRVGLMICADRRYPETIAKLGEQNAELILCPSGGMWGPEKNDHHLQARSRENRVPIVFVHPIEFLVTAPDGEILDRRFAGDVMDVTLDERNSAADAFLVALKDVGIPKKD